MMVRPLTLHYSGTCILRPPFGSGDFGHKEEVVVNAGLFQGKRIGTINSGHE